MEIITLLLQSGAQLNVKNAYGETPLANASSPADGVPKFRAKQAAAVLRNPPPPPPVPVPASAPVTPAIPVVAAPPAPTPTVVPAPVAFSPPVAAAVPAVANPFAAMNLPQLRHELEMRKLPTTGTKDQLVARLMEAQGVPSGSVGSPAKKSERPADEDDLAAPPQKKPAVEPAVVVLQPATVATAPPAEPLTAKSETLLFDAAWIAKLREAVATQVEVMPNTQEFWDLEEKVSAWNQGRNEDYVSNRLKKKKKPLAFVLRRAWKVSNPVLEEAFAAKRKELLESGVLDEAQSRIRVAFHGTREANIPSIIRTGLLRFRHPLNPCTTQADDGYFGSNQKGVYVSRYYDYTLKYANDLNPLDEGQSAKTIMFKCMPGKVAHIAKLSMGIDPTPGHHSHSSPNNLEWYLFDERQLCPDYIIEMKAQIDTRTAADDE